MSLLQSKSSQTQSKEAPTPFNIERLNFRPEEALERRAIKLYGLESGKLYSFREFLLEDLHKISPLFSLVKSICEKKVLVSADKGNISGLVKVLQSAYEEIPEVINTYLNIHCYEEEELKNGYFYRKAPEHLAVFIAVQGLPETILLTDEKGETDDLSVYESLGQIIAKGLWEGLTITNYRKKLTKRQFLLLSKIAVRIEHSAAKRQYYAVLAAISKGLGGKEVKIDVDELFSIPEKPWEAESRAKSRLRKDYFKEKAEDEQFVRKRVQELGLDIEDFLDEPA